MQLLRSISPVRLAVRTPDFHSGNRGSIPLRGAQPGNLKIVRFFFAYYCDMETRSNPKYVGYLLERTSRKVKLSFSQAFTQLGLDITPEQWVILENLYFQNGLSQTELAAKIFKNTPTISRILDLLGKKGLTERKRFEKDRRQHRVFLTGEGKKVVEKAQPVVHQLRSQGWQNLSEEDYAHLERILNQVFNNFE